MLMEFLMMALDMSEAELSPLMLADLEDASWM